MEIRNPHHSSDGEKRWGFARASGGLFAMLHSTSTSGRKFFINHAPSAPRAAESYRMGIKVMSKRAALECAHIQLQPPTMRASISIDLDKPDAYTVTREMDFPKPQLMMVNPTNGHLHAIWQLSDGVLFGEAGRRKPQKAFLDLQKQITVMHGADTAYSHYMVKTPGHLRWETVETGASLYTLAELFEAIPLGIQKQANALGTQQVKGEGRHQTLFDIGRQWAYKQAQGARRAGSQAQWEARVMAEFLELNSFAQPLASNEVRSLARSVARWTWDRAESLNGSVMGGDKRSLTKSWEREAISVEQATERRAQGGRYAAPIVNAIQRIRRDDKITQAIAELAGRGILSPTQAQISGEAKISLRTVEYWAASQRQGRGN